MKDEFKAYLNAIGIVENTYLERIDEIIKKCYKLIKEEVNDIFVDEYIKKLGEREYEGITFVSENYLISVNQFLSKEYYFSFCGIAREIAHFRIEHQDYDFIQATQNSRLVILFRYVFSSRTSSANFHASKENCDYLLDFAKKYFFPCMSQK